jgi:hypothetical protein
MGHASKVFLWCFAVLFILWSLVALAAVGLYDAACAAGTASRAWLGTQWDAASARWHAPAAQ